MKEDKRSKELQELRSKIGWFRYHVYILSMLLLIAIANWNKKNRDKLIQKGIKIANKRAKVEKKNKKG